MVAMHTEMNMHNILNVTLVCIQGIMNTFLLLVLHVNVIHLSVIVLV